MLDGFRKFLLAQLEQFLPRIEIGRLARLREILPRLALVLIGGIVRHTRPHFFDSLNCQLRHYLSPFKGALLAQG